MNRLTILAVTTVSLLIVGVTQPAGTAIGQEKAQQTSDVERVNAAIAFLLREDAASITGQLIALTA